MSAAARTPSDSLPLEAWRRTEPPAEFAEKKAPEIAEEDVSRCPVCDESAFDFHALGFDYELLTCRNPWRFVRCRKCLHVRLHPRPSLAELPTIYPPTYYSYSYEEQINKIAVFGKRVLDRMKLGGILKSLGRRPASYLDVGCGEGRFLRVLEEAGVPRDRCYGLELDARVVERLSKQGYPVYTERVEECTRIAPGSLDLVTMFHVIEHVAEPAAVVRKLGEWLAPGGVLALETPNIESLDAALFGETYWGGYHIPRHWSLFTPSSLRRLLEDQGLQVAELRYQTGHSFWMYSFHHRLRYGRRPHPRLARLFDPFRGLPLLVAFTAWDKLRAALGFKTSAMLAIARKPKAGR